MSLAQQSIGEAVAASRREAPADIRPRPVERAFYGADVKLPGFGHAPDRCQRYRPVGFCEEGHPVLGASSCDTRGCPDHWRDGVERAVEAIVARLAAYRHTRTGWEKRLVHAVASPPQGGMWSTRAFYGTRPDTYEVADEVGVRGGVCIPHGYRTNDELEARWELADLDEAERRAGKWAFARDRAEGEWSAMREFIEPAPHNHLLSAVKDLDGEAVPDGWIVKNIRGLAPFHIDADAVPVAAVLGPGGRIERDPREVALEGYQDMASVAYYLLTHGSVSYTESGHSRAGHTYFGELHPSKFNPSEELTAEEWATIQEMAAAVVGREPDRPGHGMTCPCEDCEADVLPISDLSEWMDNEDWFAQLPPRRRNQLRALESWAVLQVDRPPPGARRSKERLETWLVERGQLLTDVDRQPTGAGTAPGLLRGWSQ